MMMRAYSVKCGFNQRFSVPAKQAFNWCTDYQPSDLSLMNESGTRRIQKLNEDTILLKETTRQNEKAVTKTKLVRINKTSISWTNTHVAGPNLHSQFLYRIVPEGKRASRLFFTGLLVCYSAKHLSKHALRRMAKTERRVDSMAWKHLAKAMEHDFDSNR
jgi:hypothetical protein